MTRRYIGLVLACALLPTAGAAASKLVTTYVIPGLNDGSAPAASLIDVGGIFFGTAASGGVFGHGTVFKIDPASGMETTLHDFTGADGGGPTAAMIDVGGTLYGTTSQGGTANAGTIFKLDPATGTETLAYSFRGFPGDQGPNGLLAFAGSLYGTSAVGGAAETGTIFKFDPQTGVETSLYAFTAQGDGGAPFAAMIQHGQNLYGTTAENGSAGRGTLFRFDPATDVESTIYSFSGNADGGLPSAPLLDVDGQFYGTTNFGGASGFGTVFRYDLGKAKLTSIYAFTGGADSGNSQAGLIDIAGTLYGTALGGNAAGYGSVFAIDPATGAETTLYHFAGGSDGGFPAAALLGLNGTLYGTVETNGGTNNGGVFAVDPSTGREFVLHSFTGTENASTSPLIRAGGKLYGVSSGGGRSGLGALFAVDAATGAGTLLASFSGGNDGQYPTGAPLLFSGALYGTTAQGGAANQGTIYKVDPATGSKSLLFAFSGGADGGDPVSALTDVGGVLFGTASNGGSGSGTIFSIDPATGTEATVYTFTGGSDGGGPYAPLLYAHGSLYGTTLRGSTKNAGTVYKIEPASGMETTLYSFLDGRDGSAPFSGVISAHGLLYGTTSGFGRQITGGTIFSLDPKSRVETVLYRFSGHGGGGGPLDAVIEVGGSLYGTTAFDGAHGFGTVFKFDPSTGVETALHSFTGGTDGGLPQSSLLSVESFLYGTTGSVNSSDAGKVFRLKR